MTDQSSDNVWRLAERLVGPVGPELDCVECFEALDSYVERELAGLDADAAEPRMRAHLIGCSACRSDHDTLFALLVSEAEDAR